ncbi:polyamine aminopropyltransferase [Algicola sagamiensis]|uniref:polyamine aminopropyltransferase n=1 Tax=Algicola sagamiensis TaxID=163869 RepID=UPI0003639885|nr:polyamine aminopropyltransferase [Algicola sagamiensis]
MSHTIQTGATNTHSKLQILIHDTVLIGIMAVLAACGLIYEYLLSNYAGRVLGTVETAIYAMIGIMIVSMGIGAFTARIFKNPFSAFAWLECLIALIGVTSTLVIAFIISFTSSLPHYISEVFNVPQGMFIESDFFATLEEIAETSPYVMGFLLGALIGMEIPLIARVRQHIYGEYLENNAGTIYGADYIGAGIGAAIWVMVLLSLHTMQAAAWTAAMNVVAGLIFLFRYRERIHFPSLLLFLHGCLIVILLILFEYGTGWITNMSNMLYRDQVVYSRQSHYQHIAITERAIPGKPDVITDLYLNGRLQFSSADEQVYHSMLVYPAMAASRRHDKVLIIGGGDGLALRDVLKWSPQSVTLIDLDPQLVGLFSRQHYQEKLQLPEKIQQRLTQLNQEAFSDPRVNTIFGDAFIEVKKLVKAQNYYDTIIVDLPDPSHPDLNKLYSDHFYQHLRLLLQGDGALVIQSTSPYHAKEAFQSIGKTVKFSEFKHVEQYRQNVPSFGEWGWTIATKQGKSPRERLMALRQMPIPDPWITKELMMASFAFPLGFYNELDAVKVNYLGSNTLYGYHHKAWQQDL